MDVSEEEDLEDRLPNLIREDEGPEPRECWICFVPETENPVAQWVTPCRCAGSLGHVHQDCVKRWVEEKQNGNIDLDGESFTPKRPVLAKNDPKTVEEPNS